MIAEMIEELFVWLGQAAMFMHEAHSFVWDGPPARMIAVGPGGGWVELGVMPGATVVVNRCFRMRVEYVDNVKLLPACCVVSRWSVN